MSPVRATLYIVGRVRISCRSFRALGFVPCFLSNVDTLGYKIAPLWGFTAITSKIYAMQTWLCNAVPLGLIASPYTPPSPPRPHLRGSIFYASRREKKAFMVQKICLFSIKVFFFY